MVTKKTKPYTLYLLARADDFTGLSMAKVPVVLQIPDDGVVPDEYDFDVINARRISDHDAALARLSEKFSDPDPVLELNHETYQSRSDCHCTCVSSPDRAT